MKTFTLRATIGILFAVLIISSCSLVKDFDYTVSPNPLEMHGDSIKFTVVVNVPEKGIKKTVKAEITPKLGSKIEFGFCFIILSLIKLTSLLLV